MKLISNHPLPSLLLMLTAALLFSLFTLPLLQDQLDVDAAEYPLAAAQNLQRVLTYEECGHSSKKALAADAYRELSSSALLAAGWQLQENEGELQLCDTLAGLCPSCSAMLHLRLHQGRICVFQGPADSYRPNMQPLLSLPLSPAQLPPELQAELRRGAIEFADLEALYAALDSLDELQ